MKSAFLKPSALFFAVVCLGGCRADAQHFVCVHVDRSVAVPSAYPLAVDKTQVGRYEPESKSGAGFFYDDVLEYRVWLHPERGAAPLNGKDDYYAAFAQYEKAEQFSEAARGAEEPLALIRQYEWIDEPGPHHYVPKKGIRITEWQVKWLTGNKRTPDSISEFLEHPRPTQEPDEADDKE